jgi:hypothetical protein
MSVRKRFNIPKEHGAWAMLYVPFLLGLFVARNFTLSVLLLLLSTTALFVSRESLLIWWRNKIRHGDAKAAGKVLLVYLALGALFGLPLIFFYHLFWLIPFALLGAALLLINGKQATNLNERTVTAELIAIGGLTMTAPVTYYVSQGEWDIEALGLWALSAAYFASSVFYVKLRVLSMKSRQQQTQGAWKPCAYYHSLLLVALCALIFSKSLHLFALLAFAPVLARTVWGLQKSKGRINLKRAGVMEIFYSVIFLLFITLTFR